MSLAQRLSALMRWRGIKSQNQLARISGVPQSCIHRILNRGDHYWPDRRTVLRLAKALDTSAVWLTDGVTPASGPGDRAAPPHVLQDAAQPGDGYCTEICALLRSRPDATKKQVLTVVRILLDGRPAN